jgi:serine/threonine-protein kinase
MADDTRVQQLLEELFDGQATPEEVCDECPELLPVVRERWQRICRARAEIEALFPPHSEPGAGKPGILQEDAALPRIPGYEVEAVLGRGGMGVVYKARHLALKRTVALKMLTGNHGRQADRARFEAEAVARLQHPNVVQIHEIGDVGGRSYFALELVEGGSLARRLQGQRLPPCDAAGLVAKLAEAMHFAHSRNLVHRDLKPGNVLLAGPADAPIAQCQPKVADFGLARFLDADDGQSEVGSVMGTPSYMAPEQAEGRGHSAGPAADVYALGAILYECLTGRPPFKGATRLETLEQVRSREPAAPSSLHRRVPRDLEMICLKCLRKQQERRYSSARELADDLGRFVRGEPVAARPVGVAERAWKWAWRRPTAAGLLAALLLLGTAGAVSAWLLNRQRAQQAGTDQEVRGILVGARGLRGEGWRTADLAMLAQASREGERAAGVAGNGRASAAVRQEAEGFQEEVSRQLNHARKTRVLLDALLDVSAPRETWAAVRKQAGPRAAQAPPRADQQYAAAFVRWGLDVDAAPEDQVVERLGAEPDPVVQELIAALDNWMLTRRLQRPGAEWRRLYRLADRLDRTDRHRRLRALMVGGAPLRAESIVGLIGVRSPWPALWALARGNAWRGVQQIRKEIDPRREPVLTVLLVAQALAAVGDAAGAEQLLSKAVTTRPNQVVLFDALGKLLEHQGSSRRGEAIGYLRAARSQRPQLGLALSKALLGANRVEEAVGVLEEVASVQRGNPAFHSYLGFAAEARQRNQEAEAAYRKAIALEPRVAEAHMNLANVLVARGKVREAEAAYRQCFRLKPNLALAHSNFGLALLAWQRYDEAEAACRRAIALEPDLPGAHTTLGNALHSQGKYAEAEAAYRHALHLEPDLPEAHSNLGAALNAQGKHHEAEALCRKAIALKPGLPQAYVVLGGVLIAQQKYDEAEAACRKAVALDPHLAEAYSALGAALCAMRQFGEAETDCRKAVALAPHSAKAHTHLGNVLSTRGKHGEAEAAYRQVIALMPHRAEGYTALATALFWQGKRGEAEAPSRKAVALKPDLALAHHNLGNVLFGLRKYDEAEAECRRAAALDPALAEAHTSLGHVLYARGKPGAAEAAYRKAITLKPHHAESHAALGGALFRQGKHAGAVAAFRTAITLKPNVSWMYDSLGAILLLRGKYDEAEEACRKAVALQPGRGSAHDNLGVALMQLARFKEAADSFDRAVQLLPANSPRRGLVGRWRLQCQRYAALDARLSLILKGTEKPANASEQIQLARLCILKKHYAAAASFSRDAFTAEPKLAEVAPGARYNASCAGARAGCGQGKDANTLDDQERTRWRRQALEWLRQDLTRWGKLVDKGNAQTMTQVRQTMRHWQTDGDLAGVRAKDALARLPDKERKQWEQLWAEVDALVRRASKPD